MKCLSKFAVGTWVLVYIAAIVIVQVLLQFTPNWTNGICTVMMYVFTSLEFGLRLFFCKDTAITSDVEKPPTLANGCPVDAFVKIEDTRISNDTVTTKTLDNDQKTAEVSGKSSSTDEDDSAKITITEDLESAKVVESTNTSDDDQNLDDGTNLSIDVENEEVSNGVSATKAPLDDEVASWAKEPETPQTSDQKEISAIEETPIISRIHFLDSIKIFLTLLVVTQNTLCAFGACKQGSWYLVIGKYGNTFSTYFSMITTINQAYFMPLFYLISAYFTPTSYMRKGKQLYLRDRAKRLYLPAMFVSFTLSPISAIIGQIVSRSRFMYYPIPGPAWFSFWLLVFDWMYSTVKTSKPRQDGTFMLETSSDDNELENNKPYPGIIKRWLCGLFVCGLGMFGFAFALSGYPYFFTMPVTFGSSFINNILFFIVGIYASKYKWLSNRSSKQLKDEVWPLLYITAFIEAVLIIGLTTLMDGMQAGGTYLPFLIIGFFLLTGLFCVDMSMVVLQFFNRYFAGSFSSIGTFFAKNAYTVYLIHPIIITSLTATFIKVYNSMHGYNVIEFQQDATRNNVESSSVLLGPGKGSLHLFYGFIIVWIVTLLLCWPIASAIRKQPCLRGIL